MTSDEDLLVRGRGGDRAAFDEFAGRWRLRLHSYLAAMTGDDAQSEDLVQEALGRAWKALAGFEGRCKPSTWLFQIAVNLARNHFRDRAGKARPESDELLDALPAGRRGVLSSVIRHEAAERIALAIDRLPPSLREAFVLHYVEGLPYDEIAEITGVKVGALHVRALRARGLLRRQLGDLVDTVWTRDEREDGAKE